MKGRYERPVAMNALDVEVGDLVRSSTTMCGATSYDWDAVTNIDINIEHGEDVLLSFGKKHRLVKRGAMLVVRPRSKR